MRKTIYVFIIFLLILLGLIVYPNIEIDVDNKIIKFGYSPSVDKYENTSCFDESYFYVADKDVSIYDFDFKNFWFFHVITMKYLDGNVCAAEFLLEQEYINNFLENAIIKTNYKNIDLKSLITNKKAIVANKRYFGNDYQTFIEYVLNDEHEILYIFYEDDMLIIQVGLSDEGPKFIAYK